MSLIDVLKICWDICQRPFSEKNFFYKRRIIIDEVVRKVVAIGRTEYNIVQQMDIERDTASLDKVIKTLRL